MLVNDQTVARINQRTLRAFLAQLKRALGLRRKHWNVCLVDDRKMSELNRTYRGQRRTTDVLAFCWQTGGDEPPSGAPADREFQDFLGDVVISAETARQNARRAGHSVQRETEWLILHGVLHLLGYDHETDQGEMARLESELRRRLTRNRGRPFGAMKGWAAASDLAGPRGHGDLPLRRRQAATTKSLATGQPIGVPRFSSKAKAV